MRAAHRSGVGVCGLLDRVGVVDNPRASPVACACWVRSVVASCCVLSAAVGAQRLQVRGRVVVEVGDVDDFEALG
jgi:hypothetical protein